MSTEIVHCDSRFDDTAPAARTISTLSPYGKLYYMCSHRMHEPLEAACVSIESDDFASSQREVPCFQKILCIATACWETSFDLQGTQGHMKQAFMR
jgi:hypothetical protein